MSDNLDNGKQIKEDSFTSAEKSKTFSSKVSVDYPSTQEMFNRTYMYSKNDKVLVNYFKKKANLFPSCFYCPVSRYFPVFSWLPKYDFKKNILSDIVSGFTVAVMHVCLGMAYAPLAGVNPIYGIYMAIFPTIVYFLMGTSRHLSMGSLSIVCLQAGIPVNEIIQSQNQTYASNPQLPTGSLSAIEIISVVSLSTGLAGILLGLCNAGSISILMSDSLVSGFTNGAAVLVFSSIVKHLFGIPLTKHTGMFSVFKTFSELTTKISKTNYLSLTMSAIVIMWLLVTDFLKSRFKTVLTILPSEFIIMVLSIAVSFWFDLHKQYSVDIIGEIPSGLPAPRIPHFEILPEIFYHGVAIAFVSFTINIAMGTYFSKKEHYNLDAHQELLACGFANVLGGFFSCPPIAASLSRSLVQYNTGGKSQLASIFSSMILLLVILFLAKFLEPLPYCVLGGVVAKSLNTVLLKILELPHIWAKSTCDGLVWLLTFLCVISFGIELGLVAALSFSLLSIVVLNQITNVCLLGRVPNTNVFLETEKFPIAEQIPNIIVVKILSGIHFANVQVIRNRIDKLVNEIILERDVHGLVVVMSAVPFVDPAALRTLAEYFSELQRRDIDVSLTSCTCPVFEQMKKCKYFDEYSKHHTFPTIIEALFSTPNLNVF